MIIVYDSLTGNVERFIKKLKGLECVKITADLIINEPYILITYTTGFGEIPKSVVHFLERNGSNIIGVAGSGNMNWGKKFCNAVNLISNTYKIPILCKFELSGNEKDVQQFIREANLL